MDEGLEHLSTPYGIGGFDFPITLYDRPAIAFANMATGDMDAISRALLSPQNLTPKELKTFSTQFLGKNPNPLLKTIVDVSTNPLFLLGVGAMVLFPATAAMPFAKIAAGLERVNKPLGIIHREVSSAFTALRSKPGFYKALQDLSRDTTELLNKNGTRYHDILKRWGKLKKWERQVVGLHLDGFENPSKGLATFFNIPEWKDSALAPDLTRKMGSKLAGLSKDIRGLLDDIWKEVDPNTFSNMRKELVGKGTFLGNYKESYFPRLVQFNNEMLQTLRGVLVEDIPKLADDGTNVKGYMKQLEWAVRNGISKRLKVRAGYNMPSWEEMADLAKRGFVRSDFLPKMRKTIGDYAQEWTEAIQTSYAQGMAAGESGPARVNAFADFMGHYIRSHQKTGQGVWAEIGANRLGGDALQRQSLVRLGRKLFGAQNPEVLSQEVSKLARILAEPATYTLDVHSAIPEYIRSMAPSVAWWGKGHKAIFEGAPMLDDAGKIIIDKFKKGGREYRVVKKATFGLLDDIDPGSEQWLKTYVEDNLLPKMRGMKSWTDFNMASAFSEWKGRQNMWLRHSPIAQKVLPTSAREALLKITGDQRGSLSLNGFAGRLSHLFYQSTLGGNLSAPSKNLLQNWLTMGPLIGFRGLARGIPELAKRLPTYLSEVGKIGHEAAMKKAFPEFIKQMGATEGIMNAAVAGDIMAEAGTTMGMVGGKAASAYGAVSKAMMAPFTASEIMNRVFGFYAARASFLANSVEGGAIAKATGKGLAEAANIFARDATFAAHFPGGPMGIPKAIMNFPAPLRQFMHFPMRYLEFLLSSTRYGANPEKIYLGTLGRAVAGSTAAYYTAKNLLGVDLEQGLMTGAMPLPAYENAPFHPFPLVPPAMSVAGSLGQAIFTGDSKYLKTAGSLLIPGGVAGSRAWKSFAPQYADYKNRTPEGKIPVYNDSKALIGAMTPWQLTMRGLGLNPPSKAAEAGAAQWLLAQREKIRQYRRDYLEALTSNDHRKADEINRSFQKAYPELGEIQVKKTDLAAIHNRREISRLHRILKGFPQAYRPLMENMVTQASLQELTQDLPPQDTGLEYLF